MDYQFENLGEDRFQQLCQSLLVAEFPDVQCLPIRQPDGGRDALSGFYSHVDSPLVVYQVKYVRRPHAEKEPWKWVTETVEKEMPKVQKLIPKGATRYVLITNVSGTAHLDSGSIDKVDQVMSDQLEIPARCWWRDDLGRRLDNYPNLRWAYSELITGPDLLKMLLESGLQDRLQQRMLAVKAYLSDQFDQDKEVRFKQVELQNDLMDLFVDVPVIAHPHSNRHESKLYHFHNLFGRRTYHRVRELTLHTDEDEIGCAATLMNADFQSEFPLIVIEGAPGQGKSTIAQFICQLHRMRLLNREEPDDLPERYKHFRARLPFKIDLRDFALWLSGGNPFALTEDESVTNGKEQTLETFLARQITHHSGGAEFSVADLHAIVQASEILLVFDGLDEIADLKRRTSVTQELRRGINRLSDVAVGIQGVITSRPSVFSDSPAFPDEFLYLTLQSITKPQIKAYASRWVKAKHLFGKDAHDVQRILVEKLDQPHLADLARNPMQLAILLSLILSRGSSLPDKRTALYGSYMDLFFSREAEKSATVRDHRDLLLDIHGHIAWLLHSEAEASESGGGVSKSRLLSLVKSYLINEGHDAELADSLFAGMVERVVALVSRVEGTFEFEVQPLREYFAARFLYETAPYSPTGAEKRGTLPDRFDAIARNAYWLNVTRFYAGFFSKGELPALVDRLEELVRAPIYKYTSYPRVLAAMLLGDWVFAQTPRSMKKIIDIVLDGVGRRYFTYSEVRGSRPDAMLELPDRSGRAELFEKCLEILAAQPPFDFSLSIIKLAIANSSPNERMKYCREALQKKEGADLVTWLDYSLHLQVLARFETNELQAILGDRELQAEEISLLLRSGQHDLLENNVAEHKRAVKFILSREIRGVWSIPARSPLDLLSTCVDATMYQDALFNKESAPLRLTPRLRYYSENVQTDFAQISGMREARLFDEVIVLAKTFGEQIQISARTWATSLKPWSAIVEVGRAKFGDAWAFCEIANIASGITSKTEKGLGFDNLFDSSLPLCERVRFARLKSGSPKWWEETFRQASDPMNQKLAALVLLTWGTSRTIIANSNPLQEYLDALPAPDWKVLASALRISQFCARRGRSGALDVDSDDLNGHVSERLVAAIWGRSIPRCQEAFYESCIGPYEGNDAYILELGQRYALLTVKTKKIPWEEALLKISATYLVAGNADPVAVYRFSRHSPTPAMPEVSAQKILERPDQFPADLVGYAERICSRRIAAATRPVLDIASQQGWFDTQPLPN